MDAGEIDYRGLDLRLLNVYTTDIDTRLKELTNLVRMQESELSLLWIVVCSLLVTYIVKEHHGNR